MKKVINGVLVIGSIISLALALKYSAMPVAGWLPEKIANLWITTYEEQQQYVLVYDLAVGFIMSAMFYFVVEEIPERIKMEKAKKVLKHQVKLLLWSMEVIISLVVSKFDCSKDIFSLSEKDFLILDGDIIKTKEEISYITELYSRKDNKKITAYHEFGTLNDIIKKNIGKILEQIAHITNYEIFYSIDIEFIECIKNIEECELVSCYRKDKKNPSDCFLFSGTNKAMVEFVNLYLQLKRKNFHLEYTKTSLDTVKETQKYRHKRESGELIKYVIDKQAEQYKLAIENRTLVIVGNKYTSQIIYKQMQRDLRADYINVSDISKIDWTLYKYIVVIVDDDINKIIQVEFSKIEVPANIILVSEKYVIPKIGGKITNKNVTIIGKLYFNSIVRLGKSHIYFYKNEPSKKTIGELTKQIKNITFKE